MRSLLLALVFWLVVAPSSAQAAGPDDVRTALGQGWTFLEAGALGKAEAAFTKAFEDPVGRNTAEVYYAISAVWWERRNAMAAYLWLSDAQKAKKDSFTWDGGPDDEWDDRLAARLRYLESNFSVVKLRSPPRGRPLAPLADPPQPDPVLREFADRLPIIIGEGVEAKVSVQWVTLPNGTYWVGDDLKDLATGEMDANKATEWQLPKDGGKARKAQDERIALIARGQSPAAEEQKRLAAEGELAEARKLAEQAEAERRREAQEAAAREEAERQAAEEARLAAERQAAEERRLAEEREQERLAAAERERERQEAERRKADELRREEERQARVEEARRADEERRRQEEARRAAEAERREAERREDEERRVAEEERRAAERRAAERRAEEDRQAAEAERREQERLRDEQRAEERRQAELREQERREAERRAEAERREDSRRAEERREADRLAEAEERRRAEENRLAEERRREREREQDAERTRREEQALAERLRAEEERRGRQRDRDARASGSSRQPSGLAARRGLFSVGGGVASVSALTAEGSRAEADWTASGELAYVIPLPKTTVGLAIGASLANLPVSGCAAQQTRGSALSLHVGPRIPVALPKGAWLSLRIGGHVGGLGSWPTDAARDACAASAAELGAGEVAYGVRLRSGDASGRVSFGQLGWTGYGLTAGPDAEVAVLGAPAGDKLFVGGGLFLRHDQVFAAVPAGDVYFANDGGDPMALTGRAVSALDGAASMARFQFGARAVMQF